MNAVTEPRQFRKPNRNVPGASKGPAWKFLQDLGITRPKNEEQAVLELIEVHTRWRENERLRIQKRDALPRWKKFIISTFNL